VGGTEVDVGTGVEVTVGSDLIFVCGTGVAVEVI